MQPIAEPQLRHDHEDEHARSVRTMFDRIAPTYDALNRVMSAGIDRRWRKRAIDRVTRAPDGALLDLCAGTLDLTALAVARFPRRRIVAADFAAQMLELGKHKAPRAERVVADATNLPFADGEFAGVVCGFGMRNVADTKKAMREVRRVLAPGGLFVTLEFFRPARGVTKVFHEAYAKRVLPAVGGLISGDKGAYAYLAKSMGAFLSRDEYAELMREVGFTNVRGEDQMLGISAIVTGTR